MTTASWTLFTWSICRHNIMVWHTNQMDLQFILETTTHWNTILHNILKFNLRIKVCFRVYSRISLYLIISKTVNDMVNLVKIFIKSLVFRLKFSYEIPKKQLKFSKLHKKLKVNFFGHVPFYHLKIKNRKMYLKSDFKCR